MSKKFYSSQKIGLSQKEKKILHKILERQVKRYQFAISKSSDNPDKIKNIKNYISTIFNIVKKLKLPKIDIANKKSTNIYMQKKENNLQSDTTITNIEKENGQQQ